ncbi:MAG: hypothetical protein IKW28_07875 [Lachnospiraceae bacterium]|nr:hypothetical protein [Lachnospiraceae bacterium]
MVREERVKLMTRMAAYEEGGHKKNKNIICFFKSDYISLQLLKAFIANSIVFAIIFGLYILYDFELFMKEIYQMDLFQFVKSVLIIYVVFILIFSVITYIVSLYQYNRALQSSKLYYSNLKKLSGMYGEEE